MINKLETLVKEEISQFNTAISNALSSDVDELKPILEYYNSTNGKKIRPLLGLTLCKILGDFNENQNLFLQGIELIHNATLFHDDVIDEADYRRNQLAFHKKFSNKLAILTGDYFLAVALKNISKIKNNKIIELLSDCIAKICEGELEQDLHLYKIISIEKYLEKTRKKTALLFELALEGSATLSKNTTAETILTAKKLGGSFGMFFQIRDDLKNFEVSEEKPFYNDLQSGIYTAPVLFLAEEFSEIKELLEKKKYDEILFLLKNSTAIEKTKQLMEEYYQKAICCLDELPSNEYSMELKKLLSDFRNNDYC